MTKCTNCGAELATGDRFCAECGTPRPEPRPEPIEGRRPEANVPRMTEGYSSREILTFAEAERRFAALRAQYQIGELDEATYSAELQRLTVQDSAGSYWTLGADSGEWHWYDGARWVRRDPLVTVPPSKKSPWFWAVVGCGGVLAVTIIVFVLMAAIAPEILTSFTLLLQSPDAEATITQIAAQVYGTQTAEAPAATPTPTSTPAPTPTPTITPTPAPTTVHLAPVGGDYASLEEAAEAVPPGSTIILDAGTYRLSEPLAIQKPLTLLGSGMENTVVIGAGEGYVAHLSGGGPFAVEDITFRHEGTAAVDVVVVADAEIAFSGCSFIGATQVDEEDQAQAGLRLSGNTTGTVHECVAFQNDGDGIILEDRAQVTLTLNVASDNAQRGIVYFDESGGAARENECARNGLHGIAVTHQAQPVLESNLCGDNTEAGIRFSDGSGGVARQNIVTGNGLSGIIVLEQAQPTLEENTITENTQSGIAYFGTSGGMARGNDCSGNRYHGIGVTGQAQPTLEENICTQNTENGIVYFESAGGTARGNTCSDNQERGIDVTGNAAPTLEDNICANNGTVGIRFNESSGGVARSNTVSGSGLSGILVREQAQPTLEDNVSKENAEAGIAYFDTSGGVALRNRCTGNKTHGISVDEQATPRLEANVCTGNKYGLYVAETANPELVNNDVRDNVESDVTDRRSGSSGSAPPPAQPTQSAELPVSLRQGDARTFDDPPFMIAYANAQHTAPPTAVTIQDSGGDFWRSDGWVSLMQGGQWIEATHSGTAITSVGVQFWGDTNDGWARVLVDGVERWRGSVYGSDADWPGGAFVKYLQITGLGTGPHTVRVETLGQAGDGGGDDVTVYFFGFE